MTRSPSGWCAEPGKTAPPLLRGTLSRAGIKPFADLPDDSTFMGEKRLAMARVYMCRDDKNLYWRVDFTETNPLRKPPNGTQGSIQCWLEVFPEPNRKVALGASYDQCNRVSLEMLDNLWNTATGDRIARHPFPGDIKLSDNMLVARIGLDKVAQFGAVAVMFKLANKPDIIQLDQPNTTQKVPCNCDSRSGSNSFLSHRGQITFARKAVESLEMTQS